MAWVGVEQYVTAIEGAGLTVFVDYPHVHVSIGTRQVAVMRGSVWEVFEWGWVEHADGGGRDDFWVWADWWKALRKVKAA